MNSFFSTVSSKLRLYKVVSLVVLLLLIIGVAAGCATSPVVVTPPSQTSSIPPISSSPVSSVYDENTVTALYERSIPAVVEINTVVAASSSSSWPFQSNTPARRGQGSGFFIDGEGHILTNNHVVDNAKTVTVVLHNGKKIEAKVVGTDPQNDLALLQVSPDKLDARAYLPLGNSDTLKPGQMAIAMGSPYGLEGSVTVGVVSGVGRSLPSLPAGASRTMVNVIQTDAAINPGNSGGPLLNSRGEVIGINTAMEVSASRVGFAIPINTAATLLPALLRGGELKSPWLGIQGAAIDRELASKLGLPVERGVYIIGVLKGSPAEKAGLKESGVDDAGQPVVGGDIITAVDNVPVTKTENLLSYFNGKKPGDKVTLSLYRGNQQLTIAVELGEWPKGVPIDR